MLRCEFERYWLEKKTRLLSAYLKITFFSPTRAYDSSADISIFLVMSSFRAEKGLLAPLFVFLFVIRPYVTLYELKWIEQKKTLFIGAVFQ